jgi:hypothetical protein
VAGTNTATIPAATGTVMVSGNMPAFSAYQSAGQTLANSTFTLLQNNTKVFDTGTCFNNTGSTVTLNGISVPAYSFAPNVAGYYYVTGCTNIAASATGTTNISLYKNGSQAYVLSNLINNASQSLIVGGSVLIYLNGTSDYINVYASQTSGTSQPTYPAAPYAYFQASLVRTA